MLETRSLTRQIDYDIDYAAGTVRFREPMLSRTSLFGQGGGLDPQFIVADYEVDGVAGRAINADLRYRPSASSEVRAEVGVSARGGAVATAWLVEGELHGRRTDLTADAREQASGYGVGQVNASEDGSRKVVVDGRLRVTDRLSVSASGWHETYLDRDARRIAGGRSSNFGGTRSTCAQG